MKTPKNIPIPLTDIFEDKVFNVYLIESIQKVNGVAPGLKSCGYKQLYKAKELNPTFLKKEFIEIYHKRSNLSRAKKDAVSSIVGSSVNLMIEYYNSKRETQENTHIS